MEDVVDTGAVGQLETVRHLANALQHLKRPSIARAKLLLGTQVQGLGRAVQQAQPNLVADLELHVAVVSVVIFLGQLLSLKKTLAHLSEHFITVLE